MAYLDAQILDKLNKILVAQTTEITSLVTPEQQDLDAIVASNNRLIILMGVQNDLLTEMLLEMKQVKLGMSLALEEDLAEVYQDSGETVGIDA